MDLLIRLSRKYKLSPREIQIVHLLFMDRSNKEIALSLRLSSNTVKGYMKLLMLKLNVGSRTGIIAVLANEIAFPKQIP